MLRPQRHLAAAATLRWRISVGMFRPIPSNNRRRAHLHPVALRAAPPVRRLLQSRQARRLAPRVQAVQPRLQRLVRVACRTAEVPNNDREATPCGWLFVFSAVAEACAVLLKEPDLSLRKLTCFTARLVLLVGGAGVLGFIRFRFLGLLGWVCLPLPIVRSVELPHCQSYDARQPAPQALTMPIIAADRYWIGSPAW